MIVKSNLHQSGEILGNYVFKQGENINDIKAFDIHGSTQTDPRMAILEMDAYKRLTRARKGLEHIQICPDFDQGIYMTRKEWMTCIHHALKEKKYISKSGEYRPYVAVPHEKLEGNSRIMHMHLIVQRYNPDTKKMNDCKYSYRDNDRARAAMEIELNHARTPEKNAHRKAMTMQLSKLAKTAKTGRDFMREAFKMGYLIASGGTGRPLQVVNWEPVSFDLTTIVRGLSDKELKKLFTGIKLPTKNEALSEMKKRKKEAEFKQNRHTLVEPTQQKQTDEFKHKAKTMKDELDEITRRKKGLSL